MCSLHTIVIFVTCSIYLGTCSINESSTPNNLVRSYSETIFAKFVESYLDILSTAFAGKELIKYCSMMRKELKKMEFTYTERLARHFRYLSKMHRDDIVEEMAKYRKEYDEKLPGRQKFFAALRDAFTLQQRLQFEDYIHDLLAFGKGDLLFVTIQERTRKLLDMIVNCIYKMGSKEQRTVERTLKAAIKEYKNNY